MRSAGHCRAFPATTLITLRVHIAELCVRRELDVGVHAARYDCDRETIAAVVE